MAEGGGDRWARARMAVGFVRKDLLPSFFTGDFLVLVPLPNGMSELYGTSCKMPCWYILVCTGARAVLHLLMG